MKELFIIVLFASGDPSIPIWASLPFLATPDGCRFDLGRLLAKHSLTGGYCRAADGREFAAFPKDGNYDSGLLVWRRVYR